MCCKLCDRTAQSETCTPGTARTCGRGFTKWSYWKGFRNTLLSWQSPMLI
uniref:Uncharacterized protein n=1 Tax=Anguilla anguilla TaxID=7936 RepID=A0A0E9WFR0_ANGAN